MSKSIEKNTIALSKDKSGIFGELKKTPLDDFVSKHYADLQEQAQGIVDEMEAGKSTQSILIGIYMKNVPNATHSEAEEAAKRTMDTVSKFDIDYKQAHRDMDYFIEHYFDHNDHLKKAPIQTQWHFWSGLYYALNASQSALQNGQDADTVFDNIPVPSLPDEADIENSTRFYERKAKEALKKNPLMHTTLGANAHLLEAIDSPHQTLDLLIGYAKDSVKLRSVITMLTYVSLLKEEPKKVNDYSIEQIAVATCAELEQARILDAVDKGDMVMETAIGLLNVLSVVVSVALSFIALLLCLGLGSTFGIYGMILSLVLYIPIGYIIGISCVLSEEVNKAIGYYIITSVRRLLSGAKKIHFSPVNETCDCVQAQHLLQTLS